MDYVHIQQGRKLLIYKKINKNIYTISFFSDNVLKKKRTLSD